MTSPRSENGDREKSETESVQLDWYRWLAGIGALWVSLNVQILTFFHESFVDPLGDSLTHKHIWAHIFTHSDVSLGFPSMLCPFLAAYDLVPDFWNSTPTDFIC